MRLAVILIALATMGCGMAESVATVFGGMNVSEVQTESLTCAVARFNESVSIDCVERKEQQ